MGALPGYMPSLHPPLKLWLLKKAMAVENMPSLEKLWQLRKTMLLNVKLGQDTENGKLDFYDNTLFVLSYTAT